MKNCWRCNVELSTVLTLDDEPFFPTAGEIIVCTVCGAANIYNTHLNLEKFSAQDISDLRYTNMEVYSDITKIQILVRNNINKNCDHN